MASAVPNRTSLDYLDYLMQQERLITLPLRTVAELLLTAVVLTRPTQPALLDLLYVSWVVTAIHLPWSLGWLRRDNVRQLYLGVALIDTLLLSSAIALTGGATSPFLLAIPVQAVRVVKGSFGGRIGHFGLIATLGAGVIALAPWLAFGADAPRGIEVLLALIFIVFFSISLYQLVHYLETLTERRAILVDELHQAHERLAESSSSRIEEAYLQTLEALAAAISLRDNDTEGHSRRVVNYSLLIADQLGLDPEERKALHWGALLHDLGKLGVPDSILRKPGPLDEREWRIMRKHPVMGYEQLKHV
ncbi:MAG TPA: HD domain-containing protein, partial [Limnochordia bacterium]|nr:HD domain-containing protein [Limnochordia bacterium]